MTIRLKILRAGTDGDVFMHKPRITQCCFVGGTTQTSCGRVLLSAALIIGSIAGCAPSWQSDERIRLWHTVERAAVYNDSLSLQGMITPVVSFTDYGFRVNDVRDDTGKQLEFKSYQVFWMKELRFEAEFEAPTAAATSVNVDVEFLSRSGKQRLQSVLPLSRDAQSDYRTQLRRWRDP